MTALQAKWDAHYLNSEPVLAVATLLMQYHFLLPKQGHALDFACGYGENALYLAELGLQVDAWDISPIALNYLQHHALARLLKVNICQVDIQPEILPVDRYDVIVISRFLDRTLCNAIMAALKTDGLLFYQTFSRSKPTQLGPTNPDYLLADNELLSLFAPLKLIFYQEFAQIGDLACGERNMAYFIGQKIYSE